MRIAIVGSLAIALAASLSANAQSCGLISDEAGVIPNPSVIQNAAIGLINQGADVHVISLNGTGSTAAAIAVYQHRCSDWNDSSGKLKSNEFIIAVNPTARKKTAVFGSNYSGVFPRTVDGSQEAIYSEAANASFGAGHFDVGLANALGAFSRRVSSYSAQKAQPRPPAPTTVINNAAPAPQPEGHFGYVLLAFLFFIGVIGLTVFILRKRKQESEAAAEAQQLASAAQQRADTLYRTLDATSPSYKSLSAQYQQLSGSVSFDPNSSGLSAATYTAMARAWNTLADDLKGANTPRSYVSEAENRRAAAAVAGVGSSYTETRHTRHTPTPVTPRTPYTPPTPAQPTVVHHTTYVDRGGSNGSDLLTGVIIGEELNRGRDYDRDIYREPARRDDDSSSGVSSSWATPSYTPATSDDDNSSSGISSSWGDSSSDSSSGDDSSF